MAKLWQSITQESDFLRIRNKGKRWHGRYVNLGLAVSEAGGIKAAIRVSKKVDGRATVRNKIRRQFGDVLGKIAKELSDTGVELVIDVKPEATEAAFEALQNELITALEKHGIRRKK